MQTSTASVSPDDELSGGISRWGLVAVLFFVSALNYADRTSITALFPLLKAQLGFTDVGIGAIGSMFLWSYALASPFSGYLGDHYDRSRIIVVSLATWSLATVCTGLVAGQGQLLATRVALGLVESMYLPAAYALIAEYHPESTRATALTIVSVGNFVGLVAGGTLAGYLGGLFGWRAPLLTLGLVGIVAAVGIWFVLPRSHEKQPRPELTTTSFFDSTVELIRLPSFLILTAAGILGAVGIWIFINWLPLYFHESFDLSLAEAGFWGSSVVSVASAVSAAAGAPISDYVARRQIRYRMLLQAVLILCAAPALLTFAYRPLKTAAIAALLVYAVFRSVADLNIVPLLCRVAGESRRSMAIGLTNMLNTGAGGIGVFLAGFLKRDFDLAGVFVGVGAILVIDAALLFIGYAVFLERDIQGKSANGSEERQD